MKQKKGLYGVFLCVLSGCLQAADPQSIWCLQAGIGGLTDIIDSKLTIIESVVDELLIDQSPTVTAVVCDLRALESKIDTFTQCSTMLITGTATLTDPGTYCLTQTITGSGPLLTIAANNIEINLNSYALVSTGTTASDICIAVNNSVQDVIIKNGFLVGTGGASDARGISMGFGVTNVMIYNLGMYHLGIGVYGAAVHSVILQNLAIFDNAGASAHGIVITGTSDNVTINQVICSGMGDAGILIDGTASTLAAVNITDSVIDTTGSDGIQLTTVASSAITGCLITNTTGNGIYSLNSSGFITGTECVRTGLNGIWIDQGVSNELTGCSLVSTSTHGIRLTNCQFTALSNCSVSQAVGAGVRVDPIGAPILNITSCVSQQNSTVNGHGFDIEVGNATIRNCMALYNAGVGFTRGSSSAISGYYENIACGNTGGNYALGPIATPISSPANVRGTHNVDCSDATLDAVEVSLDLISNVDAQLDVIQSKLDVLIVQWP